MKTSSIFLSKICIILSLIFVLTSLQGQVVPRDIIWADGTKQTSNGWSAFRSDMNALGFVSKDISTGSAYEEAVNNGVLATGQYIDQMINQEMGENVLGIGHGFGGIALRYAQLANENISSMVLSGVPNQGSYAILKATDATSGAKTQLQLYTEYLEAIWYRSSCVECDITGLFKNWVEELAAGRNYLSDLRPDSDVIFDINKTENLPTVPYITLYATVDDFSLTRILGTIESESDGDALVRCQKERILETAITITNREIQRTINATNGFLSKVLNVLGGILEAESNGGLSDILSTLSEYIRGQREDILTLINDDLENEKELARMLKCQLANQLLETDWLMMTLDGSFEEREIYLDATTLEDIEMCKLDCEVEFPNDPHAIYHCLSYCSQYFSVTEPKMVSVFVAELTNGLLSESEQKLAGTNLVAEIHLPNTNQLQMTMRTQKVLVDEFKDNIFSGSLGAAFFVPKE